MRQRLTGLLETNAIFWIGVTLSSSVVVIGALLLVLRQSILQQLFLPFAEAFLSPDGIIEANTVNLVEGLVTKIAMAIVALGLLGDLLVGYAFIGRLISSRLLAPSVNGERSSPPVSRNELCLVLGAIAAALPARVHGLCRGLTYDEIVTAMQFVEVESWWKTVASHFRGNNHIAFSVLARLSEMAFGRHEWALRLPSLLLGLATICALWFVVRRLVGRRVGIAAAWCLSLSPIHATWSVSARGYAGMMLFTFLSGYLYFQLLQRSTRRKGASFVVVSVVAVYFLLYSALVTAVQFVFLLYLASRQLLADDSREWLSAQSFRSLWAAFPAVTALSAIGYVPAIPHLIVHMEGEALVAFDLVFPLRVIEYLSGTDFVPLVGVVFLGVVVGLITLRKSLPKEVAYWVLLSALPVLFAWLFDAKLRYFVYLLPYYVLCAVVGLSTFWGVANRRPGRIGGSLVRGLAILLALSVVWVWAVRSWNSIPRAEFRDAVAAMERGATDQIGLCAIGGGANWFRYYAERDLFIPQTMDEFQDFLDRYPEVRCAYRHRPWEPAEHTEIGQFLSEHGTPEEFGWTTVFTYRR